MSLLRASWVWAALAVLLAVGAVLTPDGSLAGVALGALTAIALVVAVALTPWPSARVRRVIAGMLVLAGGVWAGGLAGDRLRHWLANHEGLGVVAALVLMAAMLIVPFLTLPVAASTPDGSPPVHHPRPSPMPWSTADHPSPRPRRGVARGS